MDQDVPFERIGGYKILRRLATGGTSDVLLARAEGPHGFERTVVLKLLLQQFRRDAPMEKMFAREAAAYARLSHPAIVKLYDFFSAEGQLVMVLEYIEGLPLNRFRAMLRKGGDQLDDRASIFVASRVFAALAAAHGARDPETGEFAPVIHRDVNPSNVLLPWDGHVKLADFGIAKVSGVSSDTQAGFIKGTYGYMAPEQVRGEPVTVRTDVYAASLLLWELLARRKAIQRGALPELEILRAMAEPSLPSLDVLRPDLPQRLRDAVARGLEPLPDARSITADEMLMVLRESVTSNEGRNVLAELLSRAKAENDLLRSAPPPGVADITASSGLPAVTVIEAPAAPMPPGAVPPAAGSSGSSATRPELDVRPVSEPSVNQFKRTALGIGQVAAMTPTGGVVAAPRPPAPPPPSTRGAQPKGPAPALRPVAVAGASAEGAGVYRSVGTSGQAVSEDRTVGERLKTSMGVAPPPPHVAGDSSIPPALLGKVALRPSSAPPASLAMPPLPMFPPPIPAPAPVPVAAPPAPPPIPPPLQSPSPSGPVTMQDPPVMPSPSPVTVTFDDPAAPMRVPTPPPPPPPPAMWAALVQAEQEAARHAPLSQAPPAPAPPIARPPATPVVAPQPPPPPPPAINLVPPRGYAPLPNIDPNSLTELEQMQLGGGRGGTYALIAGVALLASAALVTALLFAHKTASTHSGAEAALPVAVAVAALPTPPATATATPTPTAAPTPPATAAPTVTPTPAPPTPPPPTTSSTEGTLSTPPKLAGHRIFVDGRYAGDSPGPIKVHCGSHSVKVGSGGTPRTVDVPCGGEVLVSSH